MGALDEKSAVARMYEKSHCNFQAGAQRTRNYSWSTLQPEKHIFGFGERVQQRGAAKAMQPERNDESFPKTVIVSRQVGDQKTLTADPLGKSRSLGQGLHAVKNRPFTATFGVPSVRETGQWNAAKCLNGEPTARQLVADADLGKSCKINCSNRVRRLADRDRGFGVPSVRSDIPMRRVKSIADHQNYGDEPEAIDLLFPAQHAEFGISEADFLKLRTHAELREILERAGHKFKTGKFNAIFNRSVLYT